MKNCIKLINKTAINDIPIVINNWVTIDHYNGVTELQGQYDIPEDHIYDFITAFNFNVHAEVNFYAEKTDLSSGDFNYLVDCKIQMAIANADEIWSNWQYYTAGQYYGRKFKFRLLLTSSQNNVTIIVNRFKFYLEKLN